MYLSVFAVNATAFEFVEEGDFPEVGGANGVFAAAFGADDDEDGVVVGEGSVSGASK